MTAAERASVKKPSVIAGGAPPRDPAPPAALPASSPAVPPLKSLARLLAELSVEEQYSGSAERQG